ncbi:hypothetical protein FACS189419_01790 [Planctomycetales bacterium]|nr:hypothetical protein FACS189419_01790 [Planctomycetales bacterium]
MCPHFGTGIVLFFLMLCSATAQTPATMFYGSIETQIPPSNGGIVSALDFSPAYVAQNTAPAAIATPLTQPAVIQVPPTPATLPPFDPYAAPSSTSFFGNLTQPPPVTSSLGQSSPATSKFDTLAPDTVRAIRRFRESTSADFTFLPGGSKNNSLGMGQIDLQMQLNFPCRFIPNNNGGTSGTGWFYVVPGASLFWWDGPVANPGMSANGFGAYLKFGAEPQFNDVFALKTWGQLGVFSDYHKITSDAIRFSADIEGIVKLSDKMKLVAGVLYLGRERVRLLPTGGVIYQPNDDLEFRFLFPNPKVTKRLWKGQRADWFGYISADYCGMTWDIETIGATDYNDIRLGAGIEFSTPQKVRGYFEFGGSFGRELYTNGVSWSDPPTVMYLKMGFVF